MFLARVLRYALALLIPLSIVLTTYLYLYPLFNLCAFPSPTSTPNSKKAFLSTLKQHIRPEESNGSEIAPFRLLALGDPQLEGDTSLPDPIDASFPSRWLFKEGIHRNDLPLAERLALVQKGFRELFLFDIKEAFDWYRKSLDLFGNDFYLAHIYRSVHWWTRPTHVTVLGDLVGSQWIDDDEFEWRAWRYWNRVFRNAQKVPEEFMSQPAAELDHTLIIGEDESWKTRIINVAGNHDIGYSGDLDYARIERFERAYGKINYELRFILPVEVSHLSSENDEQKTPELRIVVLNDMNVDGPATEEELQAATYDYINNVINTSREVDRKGHFTLLLTHIPFYKDFGVCVDGPFWSYFDQDGKYRGGVMEQNHLSRGISTGLLEGIYGMSGNSQGDGGGRGRRGLILAGHDHEGCDSYHFINQTAWVQANSEDEEDDRIDGTAAEWQVKRWKDAEALNLASRSEIPGIREVTVRSMMGDFSGNAGLVSLWFDALTWEWKFEYSSCSLGKPPLWWAVHVLDLVTIGLLVIALPIALLLEGIKNASPTSSSPKTAADNKDGKAPAKLAGSIDHPQPDTLANCTDIKDGDALPGEK